MRLPPAFGFISHYLNLVRNKPGFTPRFTYLPPTCTAASEHIYYPFTPHVHSSHLTRSLPITPLPPAAAP